MDGRGAAVDLLDKLKLAEAQHVVAAAEAGLVQRVLELRGEPAVHAEDLLVDERRHREAVEAVRESLPEPDVVPALALQYVDATIARVAAFRI